MQYCRVTDRPTDRERHVDLTTVNESSFKMRVDYIAVNTHTHTHTHAHQGCSEAGTPFL